MLSHLRFHRRGQSNPTSPNPEQSSAPAPWDPSLPQKSPFVQDAALSPDARSPAAPTNSSLPPTLPPITRVTSSGSESPSPLDRPSVDPKLTLETYAQKQQPAPPPVRSPNNSQSGFVGGVALRKQLDQRQLLQLQKLQQQQQQHEQQLQQQMAALSPDPAANTAFDYASHETQFPKSKPAPPPPINTAPPTRPPPQPTKSSKHSSSFATPTDLHQHHLSPSQSQPPAPNYAATGRRPAGTRLSSEPTNVRMAKDSAEAPKGRKGLPFLKNPMSTLLMRRKTSQNAPDLSPLPLGANRLGEPSYDPRIRGTRVHDFSAPRTRRSVMNDSSNAASGAKPQPSIPEEKLDLGKTSSRESAAPSSFQGRNISSASESGRSGSVSVISQTVAASSSVASTKARSSMNLDSKPLPDVPPKDSTASSSRSASVVSKKPSVSAASILSKTLPSTRTGRSRGASLSGQDVLSSVPRHMKSTSSRFSFDMVGAAKAEKLLEERHRQRELERKTSDPTPNQNRDSRFDDFDDEFDYDAMMDDDGMEEEIPMSNDFDDYEEDFDAGGTDPLGLDGEEDFDAGGTDPLGLDVVPEVEVEMDEEDENDPDNDQENFAGFVFQRSNPASALTSPHSAGLALTPRDADGRVIGFALSKDTPGLNPSLSPGYYPGQSMDSQMSEPADGLAIQGLNISNEPQEEQPSEEEQQGAQLDQKPHEAPQNNQWLAPAMPPPPPPPLPKKDDLYFDNGLLDELDFAGEGDGSTFDESIFDLDDTDQYGRPLPGVFAKFQAARAASNATAAQESVAQDSAAETDTAQEDAVQDTSGQEGAAPQSSKRVSDSTSRLSAQSNATASTAHTSLSVGMPAPSTEESKRQSENLGQEESSSAMTSSFSNVEQGKMEAYQAALAAAACEAAANGKFRRDSSPPPSEIMSPGAESSSLPPQDDYPFDDDDDNGFREDLDDYDVDYDDFIAEANASALANDQDGWYGQEFGFYSAPIEGRHSRDNSTGSDEKPFEYANGGFFGPSGVGRSKSGRMISREPNLTPITERSEYSNRNSIMSLGIPPGIGSGPSSLQSPGLAQLVMMADGEDNMSLTALMKLRSRAWGGSQASLVSSREGSPRSERGDGASSPWGPAPSRDILGIHNGHVRKNSAFSIRSRDMDSDAGSGAGSPTLTMSMPTLGSPTPPMPSLNPASPAVAVSSPHFTHSSSFEPVMESEEVDELSISNSISHSGLWMKSPDTAMHPNLVPRTDPTPQRRPGMGHKHKGSADSISYIKEEDEGETRWVLERRFTADSGEVEVQREVVGKGHI
ncbi:hypothetical protein CGCA056_v014619 [Colletotrichum aenigma]|uniref:uncharacterized protein n=1 Tax=Colletotrichum aenigma TaxID=1215731 RepID=UPI0018727135|nr:uncharacterized protein CGCA056_v014619 [Colletotrichum aenigma]KAF5502753.1 hypothetical protein CGCA056_v014619 [Colletotrichum aenigma]